MTRPGNKLLQFACSKERGKTERIVNGKERNPSGTAPLGACVDENVCGVRFPGAHNKVGDSLWSSSHFNFHHKRPSGTFVNGPEAMDSIAGGVVLAVLLATLVGLGFWLCWGFSQAENAIINRLGK